jgi:hypothetical protein
MKKLLLLIPFILPGLSNFGQSQSQQVIATSGGSEKKGETSIEWTLGEPVVATLLAGSIILTQGFHQPALVVTAIKTFDDPSFTVSAYPNPTDNILMIQVANTEIKDFQYVLYDMNGKVLEKNLFVSDNTAVNMSDYPSGVYLLKVLHEDKEIKSFEIVKQ